MKQQQQLCHLAVAWYTCKVVWFLFFSVCDDGTSRKTLKLCCLPSQASYSQLSFNGHLELVLLFDRGVTRIFQRGGGRLSRCSPLCISGLSRIILTKDKSRWRKYFTKKETLKKWAFQQWLLRPRYFHGVFATCIEYCRWRPTKEGGGGVTGTPGPPLPSYAPESWREQARTWWASYFNLKTACL